MLVITFLLDKSHLPSTSPLYFLPHHFFNTASSGETLWHSASSWRRSLIRPLWKLLSLTPSSKQESKMIHCFPHADESWSTTMTHLPCFAQSKLLAWFLDTVISFLGIMRFLNPLPSGRSKSFFSVKIDEQRIRPANLDYNPSTIFDSHFFKASHPG